jgi:hypothetical protein
MILANDDEELLRLDPAESSDWRIKQAGLWQQASLSACLSLENESYPFATIVVDTVGRSQQS